MVVGRDLAAAVGVLLIVAGGWSVIGTVVIPRRIRSRLIRSTPTSRAIGYWPPRHPFC